MLACMFEVGGFVKDCRSALDEAHPVLAVKEVVARLVAEPRSVEAAVGAKPGVEVLHRSADLTVATVVVPAGRPPSLPHDHRMWAVVGIYGGQEDNQFFRRVAGGLEESGGRSVVASEALAMGPETVHAICNPLAHCVLAAIHVYGGDLMATARSMWTMPGYEEKPYDEREALHGIRIRDTSDSR